MTRHTPEQVSAEIDWGPVAIPVNMMPPRNPDDEDDDEEDEDEDEDSADEPVVREPDED